MSSTYRLLLDGTPADDDLVTALSTLEVEENADLPGAIQLTLPVSRSAQGDVTYVSDQRFRPLANLAVIVTPENGSPECIFDGYVLSQKLHLETGTTNGTIEVWGQDASWLMNLEERAREWVDVTDAQVAAAIFGDYGITPADENSNDDSAAHVESGHSLMQRGSDIQFLRGLARRNGKLCRVVCRELAGLRTGFFARPSLDGDPVATLTLNDQDIWNVSALDISWDVTRPTGVAARQALFSDNDEDGVDGGSNGSGLTALGERGLADFTGQAMQVILTAPVDDAGELQQRACALLRESGWFVRCEGEADVARLRKVLRVGTVVQVVGIGALHSGKYYVWSVRHTITADAHTMKFVLLRNAVGPAPSGSGGGVLGGVLGSL